MSTQLELEALHRQESSEHNAKILETKDTRGLADLVNGKAIKSQIAEAVSELTVAKADLVNGKVSAGQLPAPLFSEVIDLTISNASQINLLEYNNKQVNLTLTGDDETPLDLLLPINIQIFIVNGIKVDGTSIEINTVDNRGFISSSSTGNGWVGPNNNVLGFADNLNGQYENYLIWKVGFNTFISAGYEL